VQIIPLQALASQIVGVQLAGQDCSISVYQRAPAIFLDLSVAGVTLLSGIICQNLNRIVRDAYLGFVGDLCFLDLQGASDPVYTGLGSRWVLAYLEASDLAARGFSG